MRHLEFRAWDKENKKMVDDFLLTPQGHKEIVHYEDFYGPELTKTIRRLEAKMFEDPSCYIPGDYGIIDYTNFRGIYDYLVMQYTEFEDAQGVKIFEGDILADDEGFRSVVVFRAGSWVAEWSGDWEFLCDLAPTYVQVIGNEFETPELLPEGYSA